VKKIGLIAMLWIGASAGATAQERERALNEVQVGFERAFKIPLEIQLLRAAVRKEAWRDLERKDRVVLAEPERVSLVASFSSKERCDLPPG
jgi:hypothetical protein